MIYRTLAVILVLLAAAVACDSDETEPPATPTPSPEATGTPESGVSPGTPVIALDLMDGDESDQARDRLAAAGYHVSIADGLPAPFRISDELDGTYQYVVEHWALVSGQWADVTEVTRDDVRRILGGEVTDWADLGGASRPLEAYFDADTADRAREALDLAPDSGDVMPRDELLALLHEDDDTLALLPLGALEPGIQAIAVNGHDPYRDPWLEAPLRVTRSIDAPSSESADEIAETLQWNLTEDVQPLSTIATGEMIPVRCVTPMLDVHGYDAMFDHVRDAFEQAELVITQLEPSLTAHPERTPCTRPTFNLQAGHETAAAMASAHIDVVMAIGNHVGDCWRGCTAGEAMLETLEHLDDAGLVSVGLGTNMDDARTPRLVEAGDMTLAFLGYDIIAAEWFGAGPGFPGIAPMDPEMVREDVEAATELADHVIVGMNWGDEYVVEPNEQQRRASRVAVEAGASLVLGNHPHWVQAFEHTRIEERPTAVTFYALGNFVFDQDWSIETQQAAYVEIGLLPDRIIGYRVRPVFVENNFWPTPVSPSSVHGQDIFQRTGDASRALEPLPPD